MALVAFCRRRRKKRDNGLENIQANGAQTSPEENLYSVAAAVDESRLTYADVRPESNPYNSVALPEYAQVDRTRKRPRGARSPVNNRADSDVIMSENSLYESAPLRRNEPDSDSDEMFEDNELYGTNANHRDDSDTEDTPLNKGRVDINRNGESVKYYNLPPGKDAGMNQSAENEDDDNVYYNVPPKTAVRGRPARDKPATETQSEDAADDGGYYNLPDRSEANTYENVSHARNH